MELISSMIWQTLLLNIWTKDPWRLYFFLELFSFSLVDFKISWNAYPSGRCHCLPGSSGTEGTSSSSDHSSRMEALSLINPQDLKPANILLNSYGEVKISDFGLSRDIQQGSMPSFSFLSSMQIPRTPLLAPIITCLQREHLVCLMSISRLFLSIPSVIAPIFGLLVLFYWNAFVDISLSLMSIPIWMYFLSFFPLSYRFNSHIKMMFLSISVPFSYSS